ncbi:MULTISPECIES: hypothetical protein [Metabacillus]|uniref:Uncharacterized protein n=2 Tax=Metabacillus TaxID=2675233 RepID=A0A179SK82_9BACI|nr:MULTISPECIES: hypothetical protein [Metabacillus]OAS82117.1 hypothetical protein A6K24_13745 [Metabacillus litoralis]QNF29782.1 hypothetical protein HUW50_21180 [Metabacillus sp. KUDC1714]
MKNWNMLVLLLAPWFTFSLFGGEAFRRFLPTATFSSLVISLISELSKSRKWWKVKKPIFPGLSTDITFVFGLFFTINLWVFKLTYKRVWLYIITNVFADFLFAYPITTLAEKFKIYKMVRMKRKHLFYLSLFVALLNYLYQFIVVEPLRENTNKKTTH